ncbi:MAG: MoaD/ThiS family protein [Lentisphaerota bacterium]
MKVFVKLIATYQKLLPPGTTGNTLAIDVPRGTTILQVLSPFGVPLDDTSIIVLNGRTVDLDTPVSEGDTISAFSAMAGG